jgi:hypothetical protein
MVDNPGDAGDVDKGGITKEKVASGALGAVLGAASTLATVLGLKGLLTSDPLVGVAVLAVVAAFLLFMMALAMRAQETVFRTVMAFAVVLVLGGVASGAASAVFPSKLSLSLRASPHLEGISSISIDGRTDSQPLDFDKPLILSVARNEMKTINLEAMQARLRGFQAACNKLVDTTAGQTLDVGRGDPGV